MDFQNLAGTLILIGGFDTEVDLEILLGHSGERNGLLVWGTVKG
jgi:hypothetical protein